METKPAADSVQPDPWLDDRLERKPYAELLTQLLKRKVGETPDGKPQSFTLAIDAGWGEGKTHFVQRWKQTLDQAAPPPLTILFDAWQADYAADPVLAFMAALKAGLESKINELPKKEKAKKAVQETLSAAVKQARRALVPASKQVLKSVLKKASGIAVDELAEAIADSNDEAELDLEKLGKDGLQALNAGLDTFFETALKDHAERKQAIDGFKASVAETLQALSAQAAYTLPMFVFVDELDRCKPRFAVDLLEGIKHLFSIPNVCFVVSTNMTQLGESVRAVYGAGFDGYGYLKRMFDLEVSLPANKSLSYARELIALHAPWKERAFPGLSEATLREVGADQGCEETLKWIARVFGLDLRSQRRVMEMADIARSGLEDDLPVHFLWLLCLCAMRYLSPHEFRKLHGGVNQEEFHLIWQRVAPNDLAQTTITQTAPFQSKREEALSAAAATYYECAFKNLRLIRDEVYKEDFPAEYTAMLKSKIADEMPSTFNPSKHYSASVRRYFELVDTAGFLAR